MNIIITGGLQGIGSAIAAAYQAAGHTAFIFDVKPERDELVTAARSNGAGYCHTDVSNAESVKSGFVAAREFFGDANSIDVLVNNAGITRDGLAVRMSEQDWDSVQAVNLKGAFLCAQQALKFMMPQRRGYIINIASIIGQTGNPGQVNYAASKAGLIALTKSLAQEYAAKNILVNAIAPGFIRTAMTDALPTAVQERILATIPLRRFGQASDVAQCAIFLSSGNADYITGQVIAVNGGMI